MSSRKSVTGSRSLWSLRRFSLRQYGFLVAGLLVVAGGIVLFAATPAPPLYTGKLLGMNAYIGDTSILQQLGVNSVRGEFDLNGSSFADPSNDDTVTNWINTSTSAHIVPLPLMEQYIEMSTINQTAFTTATVNWCKLYCAGGSYYNTSAGQAANASYAPQTLEILNEPYGTWWGYPVTTADVNAYGSLLKSIRASLDSNGLSNIAITAAVNNNFDSTQNFITDLINDGGIAAVQGVVVHAYGDVNLSQDESSSPPNEGWGQVYWVHQFLVNAGMAAHANVYVTEDGYCTTSGGACTGGVFTEAQKEANITTIINQLATVSWLKGLWYFNLRPYEQGGSFDSFGLYDPSGNKTPAWNVFQQAATTTEAQFPSEFSLTTTNPPPDTTPPTVSFSAPSSGATVSGTTTVTANASDNVGVASVQFKLDGANLGSVDTSSPYSYSWNTTGASNGSHTLTAQALDAAGNVGTSSSVTVTVNNTVASGTAHVMVIMEENRDRSEVIGASDMPYFNSLVNKYGNTTNWDGVTHPSQPNYIALISGSTQGVSDDNPGYSFPNVPNLASQLNAAGISWKGYMEGLPSPGSTVVTSGEYVQKHNPFADFPSVNGSKVVPGSQFQTDLTNGTLPSFIWYSPDLINDGHDGTNSDVDNSLKSIITPLLTSSWYQNGGVIVITWDEDEGEGKIATVVISGSGNAKTLSTAGNHYGTLATIEDLYKLPRLGGAVGAQTLTSLLSATPPDTTPPSVPAGLAATATTSSSISLSWNASTDTGGSNLAGYHVYRNGTLIASPSGTAYTDSGLIASTAYRYTVVAYDNAGNGSAASSVLTVSTSAAASITGDINNDGTVNILDLSILLSHYSANYAPADLNHDNIVNIFDLSILLANYGK